MWDAVCRSGVDAAGRRAAQPAQRLGICSSAATATYGREASGLRRPVEGPPWLLPGCPCDPTAEPEGPGAMAALAAAEWQAGSVCGEAAGQGLSICVLGIVAWSSNGPGGGDADVSSPWGGPGRRQGAVGLHGSHRGSGAGLPLPRPPPGVLPADTACLFHRRPYHAWKACLRRQALPAAYASPLWPAVGQCDEASLPAEA